MRKLITIALIVMTITLTAAIFAQADNQASTDINVSATIVKSLQLGATTKVDLNFGMFTSPSSGTVTFQLYPLGGGESSDSSQYWNAAINLHRAACSIDGEPNYFYHVTIGTESIIYDTETSTVQTTITEPVSSETLTVDKYRVNSQKGFFLLDDSGLDTLYIGATLTVPANKPAGNYSGSFELTVTYL